jgi:hypothetical protein
MLHLAERAYERTLRHIPTTEPVIEEPMLTADHVVDNILVFALEGIDQALFNDMLQEIVIDDELIQINETLLNIGRDVKNKIVQERAKEAHQSSDNKRQQVEAFLNLSIQHNEDKQNTHDSCVTNDAIPIVNLLRSTQKGMVLPQFQPLCNEIKAMSQNRPHVAQTLDHITAHQQNVYKLNISDKECLQRVWLRAQDKDNDTQTIQQNIIKALDDCVEHDNVVCVNGRVIKILGALVCADHDKRFWKLNSLEEYKNEVFELTRQKIDEVAKTYITHKRLSDAARTYLGESNVEDDDPNMIELTVLIKQEVSSMIDKYGLEHPNISQYIMDGIKREALASL